MIIRQLSIQFPLTQSDFIADVTKVLVMSKEQIIYPGNTHSGSN